jgi:hypothetical protein
MKLSSQFNLNALLAAIAPHTQRFIGNYLFFVKEQMIRLMGGRKSGRYYRRPKPASGYYRASAPGEPPAIASGRLLRSIKLRLVSSFQGEIKVDVPYAAILEGLEPSARVAPRPFVKPALKEARRQLKSVKDQF